MNLKLRNNKLGMLIIIFMLSICTQSNAQETLHIGVLAERGNLQTIRQWKPIVDYLGEKISNYQFIIIPLSQEEVIDAIDNEGIDFILTSAGQTTLLTREYGLKILLSQRIKVGNSLSAKIGSVVFVKQTSSDIQEIGDLLDKSIVASSLESYAGFHIAWREFKDKGFHPFDDAKELIDTGFPLSKVIYEVMSGNADVGIVPAGYLETLATEGKIKLADIRIINTQQKDNYPFLLSSRLYPAYTFSKLIHVPEGVSQQIRFTLMAASQEDKLKDTPMAFWQKPLDHYHVHEMYRYLNYGVYQRSSLLSQPWIWLLFMLFVFGIALTYYCDTKLSVKNLCRGVSITVLLALSIMLISASLLYAHKFEKKLWAKEKSQAQQDVLTTANHLEQYFQQQKSLFRKTLNKHAEKINESLEVLGKDSQNYSDEHLKKFIHELKQLFPQYITFTLTDNRALSLYSSEQGYIDLADQAMVRSFMATKNEHLFTLNQNRNGTGYHINIMLPIDESRRVAYLSLDPKQIVKILKSSSAENHHLMMVHQDKPTKIDFSDIGIEQSVNLANVDLQEILYSSKIKNTLWTLIDIPDHKLVYPKLYKLWSQIAGLIFLLIGIYVMMYYFTQKNRQEDIPNA